MKFFASGSQVRGRKPNPFVMYRRPKFNIPLLANAYAHNNELNDNNVKEAVRENNELPERLNILEEELPQLDLVQAESQRMNLLYKESTISLEEAVRLLAVFRVRHKLTDASFRHLLQLLNGAILPSNNMLPRTISYFNSLVKQQSDLEVVYKEAEIVIFNVAKQAKRIIEEHWDSILKHKKYLKWLKENHLFDLRGEHIWEAEESDQQGNIFINCSIYTDSAPLTSSTKKKVTPLVISLLDLPPKLQQSVGNIIWLAICVTSGPCQWTKIFDQVQPQLSGMFIEVETTRGKFKLRFVHLIADSIARADILRMKLPTGYYSCPTCSIEGVRRQNDPSTVFEPDEEWQLRTDWQPNLVKNGIKSLTPLARLIELPKGVQIDSMHASYLGCFKELVCSIYESGKACKGYFDGIHMRLLMPLEFKRPIRNFGLIKLFKASEWRLMLYLAPIYLPGLIKVVPNVARLVTAALLFSVAITSLNSKYLTERKLEFADVLFAAWHPLLPRRMQNSKAHAHRHFKHLTRLHGSPSASNAFAGESYMGFLAKAATCPQVALKQICERLVLRRHQETAVNPALLATISTSEKRQRESVYHIRLDGNRVGSDVWDFLRNNYENAADFRGALEIRIENFIVQSRQLAGHVRNSLVFFRDLWDEIGVTRPAICELCFTFHTSDEYMIIRYIKQAHSIVENFNTAGEGHEFEAEPLLRHELAYENVYEVDQLEGGELAVINRKNVVGKGFLIEIFESKNGDDTCQEVVNVDIQAESDDFLQSEMDMDQPVDGERENVVKKIFLYPFNNFEHN